MLSKVKRLDDGHTLTLPHEAEPQSVPWLPIAFAPPDLLRVGLWAPARGCRVGPGGEQDWQKSPSREQPLVVFPQPLVPAPLSLLTSLRSNKNGTWLQLSPALLILPFNPNTYGSGSTERLAWKDAHWENANPPQKKRMSSAKLPWPQHAHPRSPTY